MRISRFIEQREAWTVLGVPRIRAHIAHVSVLALLAQTANLKVVSSLIFTTMS